MKHTYLSLWAINDELKIETLKKQMLEMKGTGLTGVIFHPRFYPGKPAYMSEEYLKIVSELILYAKEIEMDFWIYDENGWPSGNADGQVMKRNPDLRKQYVELRPKQEKVGENEEILESYGDYHLVLVSEHKTSPLDIEATKMFIDCTHEAYLNGLDQEAFDYFTGFFCDEVCLPHNAENNPNPTVPFIGIRNHLAEMFFDIGDYKKIRMDYWEQASDMLACNFYRPINEWCMKHGKLFTAHLKGEENPAFSVPFNGSPFRILREVQIPCIDALERNVPNNYFPRIVSSLSQQFGSGVSMCETLGGSGWGIEPAQFVRYLNQLTRCGINTFAFHIQQLRLDEDSKKDWPPSQPLDLSWCDAYETALNEVEPVRDAADTLVVVPMRGTCANYRATEWKQTNIHNGTQQPRTPATAISNDFMEMMAGLQDFHVIDERQFEENVRYEGEKLIVGQCHYDKVIIHKGCIFRRHLQQSDFIVKRPKENILVVPDEQDGLTQGDFLVLANQEYKDLGDVLRIPYDFRLEQNGMLDAENLTRSGLPFIKQAVEMEKTFTLSRDYQNPIFYFEDFNADCADIVIDNQEVGFYWNGKKNQMTGTLTAGEHHLKIRLYPSSFNAHGPHNHMDGDVRVCSPVQYTGHKNFADRPEVPDVTRINEIHIKKFGIGNLIIF
ncbi:MAG: hypothetical protein ACI4CT_08495 [Lachnospiraceae bacterium]